MTKMIQHFKIVRDPMIFSCHSVPRDKGNGMLQRPDTKAKSFAAADAVAVQAKKSEREATRTNEIWE